MSPHALTDRPPEEEVYLFGVTLAKMKAKRPLEKLTERLTESEGKTVATYGSTLKVRCWWTLSNRLPKVEV